MAPQTAKIQGEGYENEEKGLDISHVALPGSSNAIYVTSHEGRFLRRLLLVVVGSVAISVFLWVCSSLFDVISIHKLDQTSTLVEEQPVKKLLNVQPNRLIQTAVNHFSSLRGPHITVNFPDPCIVCHNGTTYVFATNNRKAGRDHINVQVATSYDNGTWTVQRDLDALPLIAPWQTGRAIWAPDVEQLPNGKFLLYYTDSLHKASKTHCLGAAVSNVITGPYEALPEPLVCPHEGAIDPVGFLDRSTGKRYLVYKIDGNSLGHGGSCKNDVLPIVSTPLMLQEVDPSDGITFIGNPVKLLDRDPLDGPLIEAPAMHLSSEGIYFLFYSSNCFTTAEYHTSYATATEITGPYTKAARPLFITGDALGFVGPGGMDIMHHSYTDEEAHNSEKQGKHKHHQGGRMIVFHGQMTIHNNLPMKQQAERISSNSHDPIKDLHLPFVRGMYSGMAYFKGRRVILEADYVNRGVNEG